MMAGMMKILNLYNIWRGTGETVDGESHYFLIFIITVLNKVLQRSERKDSCNRL